MMWPDSSPKTREIDHILHQLTDFLFVNREIYYIFMTLNDVGPKYISVLLVRYELTGLLTQFPELKPKQGWAAFSFYAPELQKTWEV